MSKYKETPYITLTIYLSNGNVLKFEEINKVFIEDNAISVSTFRGEYAYINKDDISSLVVKYPQSKAPKAYALFKTLTNGGDN